MTRVNKSNERLERKQVSDALTTIEADIATNTSDISDITTDISGIQTDITALQAAIEAMKVPTGISLPESSAASQPLEAAIPGMNADTLTSTTSGTWQEVVGHTGKGILEFLALRLTVNASSNDIDVRLTVDGTVIWTDLAHWTTSSDVGEAIPLVGSFAYDTTDSRLYAVSLGALEYETGWTLEKRQLTVTSTTVIAYNRYQTLD